ncbi:hypothetical protein MMC34_003003 [Xylographa carneopallida]|nr:hypothetical protein [Xylographa carneopallida]
MPCNAPKLPAPSSHDDYCSNPKVQYLTPRQAVGYTCAICSKTRRGSGWEGSIGGVGGGGRGDGRNGGASREGGAGGGASSTATTMTAEGEKGTGKAEGNEGAEAAKRDSKLAAAGVGKENARRGEGA